MPSLSPLELGRLRMSVGYGAHRRGRPLSPVEVGRLIRKSLDEGASLVDCAKAIQLDGTGHIGRFLRILDLPKDLLHLVDWGAGREFIGFTAAVELAKAADAADQKVVANAILSDGLSSKEVREVLQLLKRSCRSVERCVEDVLKMRPRVERRYVFLGTVDDNCQSLLERMSQTARNSVLEAAMERLELTGARGRLGTRFFTLVGDESFNSSMARVGRGRIEDGVRSYITEIVTE